MVTTRETPTPANTAGSRIGEAEYAQEVASHVSALWGVSVLTLSQITGTNDIEATVEPEINTEYAAGMAFWFTAVDDNDDAMTLDIGAGPMPLVRQNGDPIIEGDVLNGVTYLLFCTGSEFRLQNPTLNTAADDEQTGANVQTFTSSDTWVKPATGSVALIRCWGGGGSGGRGGSGDGGGGGGGGGCVERLMDLTDLAASIAVTIGAGGTAITADNTNGNQGGNTTFGAHVTAYGGGGGCGAASPGGGGGGGWTGAGVTATTGSGGNGGTPRDILLNPAGDANAAQFGLGYVGVTGTDRGSSNIYGGGGGGGSSGPPGGGSVYGGGGGGGGESSSGTGGSTIFGGGGGGSGAASGSGGSGGTSLYGGNGSAGVIDANNATSGAVPGGGGGGSESGNSGAGGAGKCIVIVW
jgi:hypothetical protein